MKEMRFFLIPNLDKAGAAGYTQQIVDKLRQLGGRCYADDYNEGKFADGLVEFVPFQQMIQQMDAVITIGGDGTIIRSCKRVMPYEKPMLGINVGRLGFLADIEINQLDLLEHLFTEEYQVAYYKMYHEVFDTLDHFIGEHAWNFADFATCQAISRVQGNKKGIFTRDRRPKMAAHYFKQRWENIPDFDYK